jgi:predicted amidophosphoribosyltransferase
MENNEVWARCGQCGEELKQSDNHCPKCGSTKKAYKRECVASIGVKIGETRATQKREGFKGFMKQIISRWRPSGDTKLKNGVHEERTIDREKRVYDQIVKDAKTGEITHEEHEPLNQHKSRPF